MRKRQQPSSREMPEPRTGDINMWERAEPSDSTYFTFIRMTRKALWDVTYCTISTKLYTQLKTTWSPILDRSSSMQSFATQTSVEHKLQKVCTRRYGFATGLEANTSGLVEANGMSNLQNYLYNRYIVQNDRYPVLTTAKLVRRLRRSFSKSGFHFIVLIR